MIGENIKKARKRAGLTQKQLADKLDISASAVGQFEKSNNLRFETVQKIAEVLSIDIQELFSDTELDQLAGSINGILAILSEIYGNVESKEIAGKSSADIVTFGHYYLIGKGKDKFVLYDDDINVLHDYLLASLPYLVEKMGDARPEQIIIEEYVDELKKDSN